VDSSGSVQGPVAGSCEHSNKLSGSKKAGNFSTWPVSASQERLCSMELHTAILSKQTWTSIQADNAKSSCCCI